MSISYTVQLGEVGSIHIMFHTLMRPPHVEETDVSGSRDTYPWHYTVIFLLIFNSNGVRFERFDYFLELVHQHLFREVPLLPDFLRLTQVYSQAQCMLTLGVLLIIPKNFLKEFPRDCLRHFLKISPDAP